MLLNQGHAGLGLAFLAILAVDHSREQGGGPGDLESLPVTLAGDLSLGQLVQGSFQVF